MPIKDLLPWNRKADTSADDNPIVALQRNVKRTLDQLWQRLDQALPSDVRPFGLGMPRTDINETDKAIEITVNLPGIDEKDLDVSLADGALIIKGERKTEQEKTGQGFVLSARTYGSFSQSIPLPPTVAAGDASAVFKRGVLTLTLPKSPGSEVKTKKIEIKSA